MDSGARTSTIDAPPADGGARPHAGTADADGGLPPTTVATDEQDPFRDACHALATLALGLTNMGKQELGAQVTSALLLFCIGKVSQEEADALIAEAVT